MFHILYKTVLMSISLILFIGCSTKELYTMAIDYERSSANLEKKTIMLDFGKITYLENDVKSDVTVVLLHGFGADKDNWNRFSSQLNDNFHIIIPDLAGHGESVLDKQLGYSISHHSEMLDTFFKAKKVNKIHLVGNSMGGAIALQYSKNHEVVMSLTLIDSLGMIKTQSKLAIQMEKSEKNPFLSVCTREEFSALLRVGMEKPPYIPGIFLDLIVSQKCERKDLEKIMYDELFIGYDMSEVARNISIPTLILWGEKDSVFHVDNAELLHTTIKGSQLLVFKGLGHVPLLEDPELTAKAFQKFIEGIK